MSDSGKHVWVPVRDGTDWVCTIFGDGRHSCPRRAVVFCEEQHGNGEGTCLAGRCKVHRPIKREPSR